VKKIAIDAQKGGVGKTTLAVNLAVAASKRLRVALFDLDAQESAVIWSDGRELDSPHVEFLTARRLPDGIKLAEQQGFDLLIMDTPPAAGAEAMAASENADLILIPCRPSRIDLDAIKRTAKLAKSVSVPAFVVLNCAAPGAITALDQARRLVAREELQTAPAVIRERSAFKASWPLSKGVTEYEPFGKAAEEISYLKNWVFEQLHLCTPEGLKNRRSSHG
jgi:chromosome partitioning protein